MPKKGENIYKRKDGRWEGRYIRNEFVADPQAFVMSGEAKRYIEPRTMQNRFKCTGATKNPSNHYAGIRSLHTTSG